MNTKLTLNLEESVIARAKYYAKRNRTSLSKLIENYLQSLSAGEEKGFAKISPLVQSLTGVIPSKETDACKKEYVDYLSQKYS